MQTKSPANGLFAGLQYVCQQLIVICPVNVPDVITLDICLFGGFTFTDSDARVTTDTCDGVGKKLLSCEH